MATTEPMLCGLLHRFGRTWAEHDDRSAHAQPAQCRTFTDCCYPEAPRSQRLELLHGPGRSQTIAIRLDHRDDGCASADPGLDRGQVGTQRRWVNFDPGTSLRV